MPDAANIIWMDGCIFDTPPDLHFYPAEMCRANGPYLAALWMRMSLWTRQPRASCRRKQLWTPKTSFSSRWQQHVGAGHASMPLSAKLILLWDYDMQLALAENLTAHMLV